LTGEMLPGASISCKRVLHICMLVIVQHMLNTAERKQLQEPTPTASSTASSCMLDKTHHQLEEHLFLPLQQQPHLACHDCCAGLLHCTLVKHQALAFAVCAC
jgi:hypothetical protein